MNVKFPACYIIIFISSVLDLISNSSALEGECTTPKKSLGLCITLSKCGSLLNLLRHQSMGNLQYVQQSTCDTSGKEPTVCCPLSDLPTTTTTMEATTTTEKGASMSPTTERGGTGGIASHKNSNLLPDSKECGRSNDLNPGRIHGGTEAGLGTYPWMALIGFSDTKGRFTFGCGGTLINSNYVLTASHCLAGLDDGISVSRVRLGEYNKSSEVDCSDGICAPKYQDIEVEEIIIHEKYDAKGTNENDIGLIRLKQHPKLGPFVHPICLPHGERGLEKIPGVDKPVVAGWGKLTSDNPENANVLQQVAIPFKTMDECNAVYAGALGGHNVDPGRFCAGGEIGKDSCQGDSGGPLMLPVRARGQVIFLQFGIVSIGPKDCGGSTLPAIYTKISHFIPWILDHLKP